MRRQYNSQDRPEGIEKILIRMLVAFSMSLHLDHDTLSLEPFREFLPVPVSR